MGRGPKATTSRTYCMVREELIEGLRAAGSSEFIAVGSRVEDTVCGASGDFWRAQAVRVHKTMRHVANTRAPHSMARIWRWGVFLRPFGACIVPGTDPRLAPWAASCRRFAAAYGLGT